MLYPQEDRQQGQLVFGCRHCQYMEEVGSTCIYRNNLSNFVGEIHGTIDDVTSDPTVRCNTCSRPPKGFALTLSSCHILQSRAHEMAVGLATQCTFRVSNGAQRLAWYALAFGVLRSGTDFVTETVLCVLRMLSSLDFWRLMRHV